MAMKLLCVYELIYQDGLDTLHAFYRWHDGQAQIRANEDESWRPWRCDAYPSLSSEKDLVKALHSLAFWWDGEVLTHKSAGNAKGGSDTYH